MSASTANQAAQASALRSVLKDALDAYGLAQALRVQAERESRHEYRWASGELTRQQHAQTDELAQAKARAAQVAGIERARIADLEAAIAEVERRSRELLDRAGLAYVLGAPLRIDIDAAAGESGAERVAAAFVEAQLAGVELQRGLIGLADAFGQMSRWEDARRILAPMMQGTDATFRDQAFAMYRLSFVRAAGEVVESGDLALAVQIVTPWLTAHPDDEEAKSLVLQPVVSLVESGRWDEARTILETVCAEPGHPLMADARQQLRETSIGAARQAAKVRDWDSYQAGLRKWLAEEPNDQKVRGMLLQPCREAMKAGQFHEARTMLADLVQDSGAPYFDEAFDLTVTALKALIKDASARRDWDALVQSFEAARGIRGKTGDKSALDELGDEVDLAAETGTLLGAQRLVSALGNSKLLLDRVRRVSLRSAERALAAGEWEETFRQIVEWRKVFPNRGDGVDLLKQLFVQLAQRGVDELGAQVILYLDEIGGVDERVEMELAKISALKDVVRRIVANYRNVERIQKTSIHDIDLRDPPVGSNWIRLIAISECGLQVAAYWVFPDNVNSGVAIASTRSNDALNTSTWMHSGMTRLQFTVDGVVEIAREDGYGTRLRQGAGRSDLYNLAGTKWSLPGSLTLEPATAQAVQSIIGRSRIAQPGLTRSNLYFAVVDDEMKIHVFRRRP